eukprot:290323-Amorphochlora_amoeboformis.AAC.1
MTLKPLAEPKSCFCTRRDLQGASLELSNFASWAFHTLNIKPVGDIKPVGVRKADNDSKTKLGEKADVFLTAGVLQVYT